MLWAVPSWATEAQSLGCPCSCRKLTHHSSSELRDAGTMPNGLGLHLHLSKDVGTESRGKKLERRHSLRRVLSAESLYKIILGNSGAGRAPARGSDLHVPWVLLSQGPRWCRGSSRKAYPGGHINSRLRGPVPLFIPRARSPPFRACPGIPAPAGACVRLDCPPACWTQPSPSASEENLRREGSLLGSSPGLVSD